MESTVRLAGAARAGFKLPRYLPIGLGQRSDRPTARAPADDLLKERDLSLLLPSDRPSPGLCFGRVVVNREVTTSCCFGSELYALRLVSAISGFRNS